MARSAADNREAPFLDVGKNLLTYCDQELCERLKPAVKTRAGSPIYDAMNGKLQTNSCETSKRKAF